MTTPVLTLPDGATLTQSEVFAVLDCYAKSWPAVFDLYDLPDGGPHDDLRPFDLLAPNALNAWGKGQPMTAMTAAWAVRHQIEHVIEPICKRPLEDLNTAEADAEAAKVGNALEMIYRIRGYGPTTTPKFLHRLRPNLCPIWDDKISTYYDKSLSWTAWVHLVYAHVRREGTQCCLIAGRVHLRRDLSLLRLWDMLLWQLRKDPTSKDFAPTTGAVAAEEGRAK
jgi:hypothetical protein